VECKIINTETLRFLREQSNEDRTFFDSDWESKLEQYLPGKDYFEPIDLEIPDTLDFSVCGSDAENDAKAALWLYDTFHPDTLGKWCFDMRFWAWLAITNPSAKEYVKRRFGKKDGWDVAGRYLGRKTSIKHALYRLWFGAHIILSGESADSDNAERVFELFSLQDIFEQIVGRRFFQQTTFARSFVATRKNMDWNSKVVTSLSKRLNAVLGTRYIIGLGEDLDKEIVKICEDAIALEKKK
jgi:hypothetical protein